MASVTLPQSNESLMENAVRLLRRGNLAQARKAIQNLLQDNPRHPEALHLLGVVLFQSGDLIRAKSSLERALLFRKSEDLYCHYGAVLRGLKCHDQALNSYDRALAINPGHVVALYNRGNLLYELGRFAESAASYDRAIGNDPSNVEALLNRGIVLHDLKRFDAAMRSHDSFLALKPDHALAWSNRGNTLRCLRRFEQALTNCERALRVSDSCADAHLVKGMVQKDLKHFSQSLHANAKCLSIVPDSPRAWVNRGAALQGLGRFDEALSGYRRAWTACPGHAAAPWNEALLLLLMGDYASGWEKYEWRWQNDVAAAREKNSAFPLWLGKESLVGKTILLQAEQGLGDTIHFCRYTAAVAALGATVVLQVQPELKSLLSSLDGVSILLAEADEPPHVDYRCPLLSLPLALGSRLERIFAPRQYLFAAEARCQAWAKTLAERTTSRVGLVWAGNPSHRNDHLRSIPLALLLERLRGEFVCLQKGIDSGEGDALAQSGRIIFFGDDLHDFSDTAALIANLDLVISVDTAVAHLAAAMGKPTWILLPHIPDWRWLLEREDSPWYPSVRLFRQSPAWDWGEVLDRVAEALAQRQLGHNT